MKKPRPSGPVILCVGASNSQGNVSYDWFGSLAEEFAPQNYGFVNAAIGGFTAFYALRTLPAALKCQPNAMIVQIGGNDVRAGVTPTQYKQQVTEIINQAKAAGVQHIALMTLSVVRDSVDSSSTKATIPFNKALYEIVADSNVEVLDVHKAQAEYLLEVAKKPGLGVKISGPVMLLAMLERFALMLPLDWVSKINGGIITTDGVHHNSTGGRFLRDLAREWILRVVAK